MKPSINWLLQPFPLELTLRQGLFSLLFGSGFVTFFLYIFKPFGLQEASPHSALVISLSYGAVTGAVTLLWLGLKWLLIRWVPEEHWRVWTELMMDLLFVSSVGVGNMFFSIYRFGSPLTLDVFFTWQKLTFLVGFFPVLIGVMSKQIRLVSAYSREATSINADLKPESAVEDELQGTPVLATLAGDNQDEFLELPVSDLLYLSAADNYVLVYHQNGGKLTQTMLRGTLKKMEDALAGFPQMMRCHRTYLVNLNKVEKVSGNAQGFKLHLKDVEPTVPVSRSLNETIHRRLSERDQA
ncbi:MAG: LytTR family transcriptional regulator [Lewinellaceae bacterium]|nr:LytTR family transcriptional regulator [Lewinellaceae bacterium]